ncbi:MAG: hypothetical protein DYG89_19965 [Caldilinea sp. CFX5]|nr:hypothetical protein [Caldilinea sp. CFX5]
MKHKQNNELADETVVYTDEPLEFGEVVVDFLPSPAELANARSQVFVRIALDVDTLAFFKQMAKKQKISHQAVLENLLESYAQRKLHANHILEAVTG